LRHHDANGCAGNAHSCHQTAGPALGDLGYRGKRLAEAGQALGITVEAIARGRDGQFIPAGICWVVERSFAWLSRYRRLNTIFERSKDHLIAFVAIAFISILSRRLKRLVVDEISA
jgi:transposase